MEIVSDMVVGGGISLAMGGACGYAIKKVAKIVAIVIGLFVAALIALEYYGLANINWQAVKQDAVVASHGVYAQLQGAMQHTIGSLHTGTMAVIGVGFIAGFAYGFHKG
jgi:uncharacterized membrane protein (Fun14 family)